MQKNHNILFISAFRRPSGAEQSLSEMLERLSFRFTGQLNSRINKETFKNRITAGTLRLVNIQKTSNLFIYVYYFSALFLLSIKMAWLCFNKRIEIIYANTIKANFYGVLVKIFTGKKLVFHVRDCVQNNFIQRYLIRKSDRLICISNFLYDQLHVSDTKKKLIYGGIDINVWNPNYLPEQKAVRKQLNLNEELPVIAQVGQLTPWKKQFEFIEMAALLLKENLNLQFIIVGDILSQKDKGYKDRLNDYIVQLGLSNNILIYGHAKEVTHIYKGIDILIHPVLNEPFGRVLIEAMAMETPVVAFYSGGPKEIIINGETGFLVEPLNREALAKKTMELINNDELRTKMGKAGRQHVIEKFNIERCVREMEAVFDNL